MYALLELLKQIFYVTLLLVSAFVNGYSLLFLFLRVIRETSLIVKLKNYLENGTDLQICYLVFTLWMEVF